MVNATFTATYTLQNTFTWQVPPGVSSVQVQCVGAGGGGGGAPSSTSDTGGGGGGGEYAAG